MEALIGGEINQRGPLEQGVDMADDTEDGLTPAPLSRKVRLIYLTLFRPEGVAKETMAELSHIPWSPEQYADSHRVIAARVRAIRWGIFTSFATITITSFVGFVIGRIALRNFDQDGTSALIVGSVGGLIFVWATLALQGANIETLDGTSLPERVNEWFFRGLHLLGILLVVASVSWGLG